MPYLVKPLRLDNSVHPAVKTRPWLELMQAAEGSFTGGLNEIVAFFDRAGKAGGEPA